MARNQQIKTEESETRKKTSDREGADSRQLYPGKGWYGRGGVTKIDTRFSESDLNDWVVGTVARGSPGRYRYREVPVPYGRAVPPEQESAASCAAAVSCLSVRSTLRGEGVGAGSGEFRAGPSFSGTQQSIRTMSGGS